MAPAQLTIVASFATVLTLLCAVAVRAAAPLHSDAFDVSKRRAPVVGAVVVGPPTPRSSAPYSARVYTETLPLSASGTGEPPRRRPVSPAEFAGVTARAHASLQDGEVIAAVAAWRDEVSTTGWGILHMTGNATASNSEMAYGAGFLEGKLTQTRIYQSIVNNFGASPALPPAVVTWLAKNAEWVSAQVKANPGDSYWEQVDLLRQQVDGLYHGYAAAAPKAQQFAQGIISALSQGGDIGTIAGVVGAAAPYQPGLEDGHCSALIKLTEGNAELFTAQETWSSFTSMLRKYAAYDMPYRVYDSTGSGVVPAQRMAFSGYPGSLVSGDDFNTMSSGLVSQETTIGCSNATLSKQGVVPTTVLEWVRVMVANRLATSGEQWTSIFAKHNSGTYNNQWMVTDYKRFTPGSPPQSGALWVIEQIPTYTEAHDQTPTLLSQGYWASYNIAAYPKVFNMSGMWASVAKYGDWFTHDKNPRALIFKRDQGKVHDLASMAALMRYNDFEHDPLSRCDCSPHPYSSENAIACRDDLNPPGTYPIPALGPRNHAATDAKITSHAMMMGAAGAVGGDGIPMAAHAVSSPTYDQQPVFVWSTSPYANVTHLGQPDRFDFKFEDMSWQWL